MRIPTHIHGLIDYAAGLVLATAPRAIGWQGTTRTLMEAAAVGSAAYALATDYEWGAAPMLTMDQHLAVDTAQGVGFLAAAALLSDEPRDARLAMAGYGLFALTVVALSERRPRNQHADLRRREIAAGRVMADQATEPVGAQ